MVTTEFSTTTVLDAIQFLIAADSMNGKKPKFIILGDDEYYRLIFELNQNTNNYLISNPKLYNNIMGLELVRLPGSFLKTGY